MRGEHPGPGSAARDLIDADARYFLHQAASTPCVSGVRRAYGVWVEEIGGRRFMDFHGNSVHHLGYAHPRLVAALKAQLDELTFSPRRFTNEPAVALARRLGALAPEPLGKVLLAPSGNDAMEIALRLARVATGRYQTVSFRAGSPRAGPRRPRRGRGARLPVGPDRPAPGRDRARGPADVLSLPVRVPGAGRPAAPRRLPPDLRELRPLRPRAGGRRGGGGRRADPLDGVRPSPRALARRPSRLRRARRA